MIDSAEQGHADHSSSAWKCHGSRALRVGSFSAATLVQLRRRHCPFFEPSPIFANSEFVFAFALAKQHRSINRKHKDSSTRRQIARWASIFASITGPHRLVVRTSRRGRDNPGSTPGVVIAPARSSRCSAPLQRDVPAVAAIGALSGTRLSHQWLSVTTSSSG